MHPARILPDSPSYGSLRPHTIVRLLLFSTIFLLSSPPALAQRPRPEHSLFLRAHGGLSGYLGDNNTLPFNPDAFTVEGKWPYSAGFELGYQFKDRWSASVGLLVANYPIITRFYPNLNVEDHPTRRRTFQLLLRHRLSNGRVAPYVHFGYHATFGEVTIFEESRLESGRPLNTQRHYIHGPLLGLGLDYAIHPRFSLFVETSAHVTLMDDSVDGRLPLGPPQPTNLDETNRFGTFDLLNAYSLGFVYRPLCGSACSGSAAPMNSNRTKNPDERSGRSMIRVSRTLHDALTTASFYYAPPGLDALFIGVEGGLGPRSIFVRYTYPDGQDILDTAHFTGAFVGLSTQWYPFAARSSNIHPHVGFTAAIPAQGHLVAGVDYSLGPSVTLGVEGRYAYCPTRRQVFRKGVIEENIGYRMNRVCDYEYDVGLTMGYRMH